MIQLYLNIREAITLKHTIVLRRFAFDLITLRVVDVNYGEFKADL